MGTLIAAFERLGEWGLVDIFSKLRNLSQVVKVCMRLST